MSEKEFLLKFIQAAIERMGGVAYVLVLVKDELLKLCGDEPVKFFSVNAPQSAAPDEFKKGVIDWLTGLADKIQNQFVKSALETIIKAAASVIVDYLYDLVVGRGSASMKQTALGAAAHAELFGATA